MIELSVNKLLQSANGTMPLNVNISIEQGCFLTLYGKSGAGKTTLLRMLAGLIRPDRGAIKVNDNYWFDHDNNVNLSPQVRNVGLVFQDYALFPNMTVQENLRFVEKTNKSTKIIDKLIDIMELGGLQHHKPETLSGGQKQRVALARSLVQQPQLLLLDEPLSALDSEMRTKLQQHLITVHKEFNLTTILVSHDVSEIIKTSDKMAVLEEGEISKIGTPTKMFTHDDVSGKFQFVGELVAIEKEEVVYILTILIGKEVVKIIADDSEVKELTVGDKLLVASKAFNPVVKKLE